MRRSISLTKGSTSSGLAKSKRSPTAATLTATRAIEASDDDAPADGYGAHPSSPAQGRGDGERTGEESGNVGTNDLRRQRDQRRHQEPQGPVRIKARVSP